MALGAGPRAALRSRVSALLAADGAERAKVEAIAARLLHDAAACTLHLPAAIGNFTDFFAGIHHATNGGRRRDPNNPLSPNYKYVPVAYHSRASSVRPSGVPIRRPNGQRKAPDEAAPSFGPAAKLDYELELAVWIGPGNALGRADPDRAGGGPYLRARPRQRLVGARRAGLGIAAAGAVPRQEFRLDRVAVDDHRRGARRRSASPQPARPAGDPRPLPHLWDDADQRDGAFDIALEALMMTEGLRAKGLPPHRMSASNTTDLYWTLAQLVAHHASGGCNLRPGDLFGTGTISGPTAEGYGSLMELSADGSRRITLASGETRTFTRERRRGHLPRPLPAPGLRADRLWRVPRPDRLTGHSRR